MPPYAHPGDRWYYSQIYACYLETARNAQRPTGVRLGNLEREKVPARVDALDVRLALMTAEAMLGE